MPRFEFHFDLASILLASVLTVLGISTAEAERAGGGHGGEFHGAAAGEHAVHFGGKGGSQGGDVRNRGDASAAGVAPPLGWGGKGGSSGGDIRNRN